MSATRQHRVGNAKRAAGAPSPISESGKRKVLDISGLETYFFLEEGTLEAVRGVDLTLYEEEMVALVGESGCGKSVTALSVMGLTHGTRARIVAGEVWYFDGEGRAFDLRSLSEAELSRVRGNEIAMIFQDPLTSLNPVITVGEQVAEVVRRHAGASRRAARARAEELLDLVGLPDPASKLDAYPHELSGGMRQRVMIAIALALGPRLLIADEPTTALDVTIQAQVLELLSELRGKVKTSVLLITHDLGVVAQTCSFVNVMYAGRVVESCPVGEFFRSPRHPYSRGLIESLPRLDRTDEELVPIPGQPPDAIGLPAGCPFAERCPDAMDVCRREYPPESREGSRTVACWLYPNA